MSGHVAPGGRRASLPRAQSAARGVAASTRPQQFTANDHVPRGMSFPSRVAGNVWDCYYGESKSQPPAYTQQQQELGYAHWPHQTHWTAAKQPPPPPPPKRFLHQGTISQRRFVFFLCVIFCWVENSSLVLMIVPCLLTEPSQYNILETY